VIRRVADGFELDDDRRRVDLDSVHAFLSTQAPWALGRSRATTARLLAEASRVVGLYDASGRQAGFARCVSDGVAFAYLADVYVLPEFRGRGLGYELVREIVETSEYASLPWILHTADASGLYAKLGFGVASPLLRERVAPSTARARGSSEASTGRSERSHRRSPCGCFTST
jgi:GNAT superfamily N-acetyltransferase